MTDFNNDHQEDFLQDSMEFEAWLLNTEASIMFKGKSLADWSEVLRIPTVSVDRELTITELELLHNRALGLIEEVMSNLAIAKSANYSAKSSHELAMIRCRKSLIDAYSVEGRKLPTNDNIEKLCINSCIKTYKIFVMSEVICEFWNIQSFKLSRFNERLTSLNYAKQR